MSYITHNSRCNRCFSYRFCSYWCHRSKRSSFI